MQISAEELVAMLSKLRPVNTGYQLVRVGNEGDGGYLLPDCLSGIECCLSPGTGCDPAVELILARQYGIFCLLCDPGRPDADINSHHKNISFKQCSLGSHVDMDTHTVESWLLEYGMQDAFPMLLLMDIEGGEYSVFNSLSDEQLYRFRTISVEFHALAYVLSDKSRFDAFQGLIDRLLGIFDIVHIAPNNNCPFTIHLGDRPLKLYDCFDVTFLNKSMRRMRPSLITELPNPLDFPHVNNKPPADYTFLRGLEAS